MQTTRQGEIQERLFRLLKNGLTLAFVLTFLGLLRPELMLLLDYVVEGLFVSSSLILNVVTLLFVVYFGYFILMDAKYFLDKISRKFERQEQGRLQNIMYDITGLISIVLVSALVTPILASIHGVNETIFRVFNIILLAIGFLLVYHLASQIYSFVKSHFEKIFRNQQVSANQPDRKNMGDKST